jgi:hypothetical protein
VPRYPIHILGDIVVLPATFPVPFAKDKQAGTSPDISRYR